MPHDVLAHLLQHTPSFTVSGAHNTEKQVTCVQQPEGWLLICQEASGSEKAPAKLPEKSSIKTLIENNTPISHSFDEHTPQGILFLDQAGRVLYANRTLKELFPSPETLFSTGTRYLDLGLDDSLQTKIKQLLDGSVSTFYDVLPPDEPLSPDENTSTFAQRHLSVHGTPVRDTGSKLLGAILTLEIRHLPPESAYDPIQLDPGIDQLKNVFVAMMSHELRTPLGVMNGYAEILSQELVEYEKTTGVPLPPQIHEFVSAIHQNAQRILGLVNELFDLSNMRHLSLSPISLHETLTSVTDQIHEEFEEKGIAFNIELNATSPTILSNPNRLAQVVDHLLSNAIKFTMQGSVSLRTYVENQQAVVEVTDTGIGISEDHLGYLFKPFVQEDMRVNRKFQGAGLGLSLVKLLLDHMRGRIEVNSEKGKGSVFRIFLPLA